MIVTKIESQKHNYERMSIYLDDAFAFGLQREVVEKFGIQKGATLDKGFIEDVLTEEEKQRAFQVALKILARSQKTEGEMCQKLKEKGFGEESISASIRKLTEQGYLDDTQFARMYVRDKMKFKRYGKIKLEGMLRQKGVDNHVVEEVFREINQTMYYENAMELAIKKQSQLKGRGLENIQIKGKINRHLLSKGYTYDLIVRVLDTLKL